MRNRKPVIVLAYAAAAALAMSACAGSSSGGGAGTTGDTVSSADTSLGTDAGALKDGAAADGAKTGDGSSVDGGSTADTSIASADLPVQDTGRGKDAIAKNLAEAKKAEADFYLAYCKLNFKCPTDLLLTNAEGCKSEMLAAGGESPYFEGLRAVAAGTAKFDPSKAAACQATLDTNCTFFKGLKLPAACNGLFVGLVDNDFACTSDIACKSGYCKTKKINEPECAGLCAAPAKLGAPCTSHAGCEGGNVCSAAGTCGPYVLAKKGEDCTEVQCVDGLNCLENGDEFSCFEPKAEGAACLVDEFACNDTAYCLTTKVGTAGKCKAKVAAGKTCDLDSMVDGLSENPCVKDHVCAELSESATSAVCAPVVALGQPCSSSAQCKGWDEICDGAPGKEVCKYLPKKGEACDPLDEDSVAEGYLACLPPFVCDDMTSKCIDLPTVGQPCAEYTKCAVDLYCYDNGKCGTYGKLGEDCVAFEEEGSTCDYGLICGAKNEKCVLPVCQ